MRFQKCTSRWSTFIVVLCFWLTVFLVMRPIIYPTNIIPATPKSLVNASLLRTATRNETCAVDVQLSPCSCNRTLQQTSCSNTSISTDSHDHSTCGRWADLRGPGQKVVSFSLYGKFPGEYYRGMEVQVERVLAIYPGWTIRVYIDWSSPQVREWACTLACNYTYVDFCDVKNLPDMGDISKLFGMSWRFSVVGDPLVDRYIVRDADMPLLQREVDAVNQWLTDGKCYHVMRDNPYHGVPMMGGMWGGCNSWERDKAVKIRKRMLKAATYRSSDQPVLWSFMWPLVQQNSTVHDSYTCKKFRGTLPFPTQRHNRTFVGMRTYRKQFVQDAVWPECPESCRPPQHKDWKLC